MNVELPQAKAPNPVALSADAGDSLDPKPAVFRGRSDAATNRQQTLILMIDDDSEVRENTARILEKAGFRVVTGGTVADALRLTRQHRPAMTLLDVVLPDGSGVDAARTLKQDQALADVFIILISGFRISPEEQAEGLSKGLADGYIARPFSQADFLARIDAFLRIRAVQEALRTALSEKEVLLKEVHHRVKNNLAVILGLLDLQGQMISDESARASMMELSNRIRSMALVHEQLYQSNDFSQIDFQDYLETLCVHLRSSYHLSGDISVSVSAVGVMMGLDIAVPCGLLITELVTNSFKHGFPASRSRTWAGGCKIDVSAQWDGIAYTLAVADNGVGLPAGLDWSNTKTMGLVLVKMLGQHQLHGRIEVDCTGGTMFRLRFAPSKG